jgi:hypothetical protein
VFAHGNMSRTEALELASATQAALGSGCVAPAAGRCRDQCVALPAGRGVLHTAPARNLEEENCAVEVYYQVVGMVLALLVVGWLGGRG